jgi:hypothetical protein
VNLNGFGDNPTEVGQRGAIRRCLGTRNQAGITTDLDITMWRRETAANVNCCEC